MCVVEELVSSDGTQELVHIEVLAHKTSRTRLDLFLSLVVNLFYASTFRERVANT